MKKKKLVLGKKLMIQKGTVANLSGQQLSDIKGGAPVTLRSPCATYFQSCDTIPYTQQFCVICDIE
ncbi:hypothetical protein LX64_01261 [Chitinophaga skermanii]|uniref:Uncharacterized protein n=1 Tax=Chitinophaga skermanii TaxID=331697 RepID=A0A327QXW3_9BACT|nr:class I lanthipeptide [Chitinophaga skermanii]RAJ08608.1 hypothetical protein LX64_01261 [Chitinophaga skermanii]